MFEFLFCIVIVLTLSLTVFVLFYLPHRTKKLEKKNIQFRKEHQKEHDSIDALFNQKDRTVNGLNWHYIDGGNPEGEVILFLHGLPEGWYSWRYVLPLIDRKYRLIAIDMKGYGRSDLINKDYDWHHVARQTFDFIDSLGINKFFLVSHDWGSIIGSVLCVDNPNRVLGYVRMEADLIMKGKRSKPSLGVYLQKPQWLLFQFKWIAEFLYQDAGMFIDLVYNKERMLSPFRQEDRDYLTYEYSRPGVADTNPLYFQSKNWDLFSAIGKIGRDKFPFPILQLQADSDPAQPIELFANIEKECPHVQLKWIANASHFDNFDQPQQVAAAINIFVDSIK
jgi:pimeloyl-ACP methyl ester carboxylesterase